MSETRARRQTLQPEILETAASTTARPAPTASVSKFWKEVDTPTTETLAGIAEVSKSIDTLPKCGTDASKLEIGALLIKAFLSCAGTRFSAITWSNPEWTLQQKQRRKYHRKPRKLL